MLRILRETGALLLASAALCIALGGASVWLQYQHRLALDGGEVGAGAMAFAAAMATDEPARNALQNIVRQGYTRAWFLDHQGRVLADAGTPVFEGVSWQGIIPASSVQRLAWEGRAFWVAAAPSLHGTVVLARPVIASGLNSATLVAVAGTLGGWLMLALGIVLYARRRRSLDPALRGLAERLSVSAPRAGERDHAVARHGEQVLPLFEMADRLASLRSEADDARALARAFLQVGRHYTIICTLDGRILDANPAFVARSGLTQEQLRDVAVRPLAYFLPLGDLLSYARRSLEENAVISGITCPLTVPGDERYVEVSLRTVQTRQGALIFLVLSDRTEARQLEHQIDQFTDALDLMVDQRVARITASRNTLDEVLEDAGLPVMVFGREGATERMNAPAERLLGRTQFTLPHFSLVAEALYPDPLQREVFSTWFWGTSQEPFSFDPPGSPLRQSSVWAAGRDRRGEEIVRRALIGTVRAEPHTGEAEMIRRIDLLVSRLDASTLEPGARAYVDVIREAVRRLERVGGGDGASTPIGQDMA